MISLLDPVELRRDRADLGLDAGQVGAVVHVHGDDAFEVEFAQSRGQGPLLVALTSDEITPAGVRLPPAHLRFLVFKAQSGGYGWRLLAADAQIIATGETYRSKNDCLHAIRLLASEIRQAEVLDQTAA